ncbi:aldolase/citrate lyase family protein [Ferruginibacter sp. SUN002]|uniref:aldolase/citrate lyase family protein n=1 Tax=Ferruginibacter sp. SUN002 TaxID=2937789 RepID=UPI003D35D4A1
MKFNKDSFELLLFTTNINIAKECLQAGVDAIIIDWENKGKNERQSGYPTQINYDTVDDLINMRKNISGKIICRINKFNHEYSAAEIDLAINSGADEIFLPMVEDKSEVNNALELVNNRCKMGILIETDSAVQKVETFNNLPLSRVYVGLNDLQISRKSANMFLPLVDDTVRTVKSTFKNIPVGVGGMTHPDEGYPIPAKLLIQQYINLDINFSFLRRAFLKDLQIYGADKLVSEIRNSLQQIKPTTVSETNEQLRSFLD